MYPEATCCRQWTLIDGRRCELCICNHSTYHWMNHSRFPQSNSSPLKWWMLKLCQSMLLLQYWQPQEDCHVACSSSSWGYALAFGNQSTSAHPSLSNCLYPSYPTLELCHLYRLDRLCHPSFPRAELLERAHSLSLDHSLLFNKLGDNLIGCGGHCGIFVHH